jgi:uncharacterized membrane protein
MEISEIVSILLRWIHIVAGILWIGLLYFFNFVYLPFAGSVEPETRAKIGPGLLGRALYFFRWSALYTWIAGFLLLGIVFYQGGLMFEQGIGWTAGSIIMAVVAFAMFGPYNALAKSPLGKNNLAFGVVSFIIIAIVVYLMNSVGSFSYRAYLIHTGAMFGTIMVANVWQIIWPGQKKVFAAIKEGKAPDPAVLAMVGQRSRHNTYLSVPLIWTMINSHSTATMFVDGWYWLLVIIAVGWILTSLLYRKAGKVQSL